jgi:hypothetical protein
MTKMHELHVHKSGPLTSKEKGAGGSTSTLLNIFFAYLRELL